MFTWKIKVSSTEKNYWQWISRWKIFKNVLFSVFSNSFKLFEYNFKIVCRINTTFLRFECKTSRHISRTFFLLLSVWQPLRTSLRQYVSVFLSAWHLQHVACHYPWLLSASSLRVYFFLFCVYFSGALRNDLMTTNEKFIVREVSSPWRVAG